MKKHLLILILALPIFVWQSVKSQQNEFAPIGATWYLSPTNLYGNPKDSLMVYTSISDTLISGITCKIISNGIIEEYMYELNGKVYFWQNNNFNLLYDYNANVNDTLDLVYRAVIIDDSSNYKDTLLNVKVVVNSVTQQNVGSVTLKNFQTSIIPDTLFPYLIWEGVNYIETIGSVYGEFIKVIKLPYAGYEARLRCYQDDIVNFTNEWWSLYGLDCDFVTEIINLEPKNIEIEVYPNPCSDIVNIELHSFYDNEVRFNMFNINGQLVKSEIIQNNGVGIFSINVSDLPKGIYILNIQSETRQFNKKVVIH